MFNQEPNKPMAYSPKAGPAEIQVMAVNYSKEEYKEITGRELPYDPNYDPIERNGDKIYKLVFLTYGPGGFVDMNFYVGKEDRPQSQSGKYEWVNNQGQTWWTDDPTGNTDYSWINTDSYRRRTRVGEANLINFMIALFNPSNFGDDNDFDFLEEFDGKHGGNFDFDGDLNSYRTFLEMCDDNLFTGLYEVSIDEEQSPVKLRQRINTRNVWRGKSLQYATKAIRKAVDTKDQYFSSNLYAETFCEVSAEPVNGKICYTELAGYNNANEGAARFIPVNNKSQEKNYELPF